MDLFNEAAQQLKRFFAVPGGVENYYIRRRAFSSLRREVRQINRAAHDCEAGVSCQQRFEPGAHDIRSSDDEHTRHFSVAGTSLHVCLPRAGIPRGCPRWDLSRSEEHTSELQSRLHLVCRLLLEKKKTYTNRTHNRS